MGGRFARMLRRPAEEWHRAVAALEAAPVRARARSNESGRRVLAARFLVQDESGVPIETTDDLYQRVAQALAEAEAADTRPGWTAHFEAVMSACVLHPGSRVLANAGRPLQQLGNCFVLPIEDDQRQILETFAQSTYVKSHGGGCGFNFSAIRPRGDTVRGVAGIATGPVKYVRLFDQGSELVRQQGQYECGNMSILDVDHADIEDFVRLKQTDGALRLTNISVGASDAFMRAVADDDEWALRNPRTGSVARTVKARALYDTICECAWATGDPGMLFLDRINESNPLRAMCGEIRATNTCGEIGLYPFEACNLGYLNLTACLLPDARAGNQVFDWELLEDAVALAVRMLDDAISVSWFPLREIRDSVQGNRRIGIGVTGWADCLAYAEIPYDSEEALTLARQLGERMYRAAFEASCELAVERGPFPNVGKSRWRDAVHQPRNVGLLALPPSGNNALIFGTSFSIEPLFGLTFVERMLDGTEVTHRNTVLDDVVSRYGIDPGAMWASVAEGTGSLQAVSSIPERVRQCFKTALEIEPLAHVRMQAAFQQHVDNAVTKTVNLPSGAVHRDVAEIYMAAWRLGCKGITVYRDGCRRGQAMTALPGEGAAATDGQTCVACAS